MSEKEFHRGNLDDWVPVKAKVSSSASVVFSLRFTPGELDILRQRAKEIGTTISGLIRSAALESDANWPPIKTQATSARVTWGGPS